MSSELWKYCGPQQEKEFLLSLNLLPAGMRERMSGEAQLALLYSLSNHTQRHYRETRIPKKGGGSRRLLVPDGLLKACREISCTTVWTDAAFPRMPAHTGRGFLPSIMPHRTRAGTRTSSC